jgi:hypothetical protein
MNKELNEVRSVAVAILADRLGISPREAKRKLTNYLQRTTEYIGRPWTVDEWEELEEYAGIAVSEILSNHDPVGRD